MKTLNIYVAREFLCTAALSVIILTFGLTGVRLIKIIEALSKGVPFMDAFNLIWYAMPFILSLAIPSSILVATMLVFGKMSANNEITAMRACGISVLEIISPIILLSFLAACLCLYLQLDIGPKYMGIARSTLKEVGANNPLAILEPGMPIEYENINIFIDDKDDKNKLKGIQVYVIKKDKSGLEQDVHALSGEVKVEENAEVMTIILFDAIVKTRENDGSTRRTSAKRMEFSIDFGNKFNQAKVGEKPRYLTLKELFSRMLLYRKRMMDTTQLEVELNQRIALGLSSLAFLLLGLPLAIRTSRRETSVGLFLSVILAGVYFISIMIFHAFDSRPEIYPQYLLWIPNILYQVGGIFFLYKIVRR
jgi:lipopolysaccharide export LptBFGC system permease protein LptF